MLVSALDPRRAIGDQLGELRALEAQYSQIMVGITKNFNDAVKARDDALALLVKTSGEHQDIKRRIELYEGLDGLA